MMETIATPDVSILQRVSRIEKLSFEQVIMKLMDKEGWTLEQTLETEKWYKRFLILCLKYPDSAIVPDKQIDTFWHAHILDTMKYAEDCNHAFGYFLHHFPYYGMRGEQDAENLKSSFSETLMRFEEEFGESLSALSETFTQNENSLSGVNCSHQLCHSKCRCSDCNAVARTERAVA